MKGSQGITTDGNICFINDKNICDKNKLMA